MNFGAARGWSRRAPEAGWPGYDGRTIPAEAIGELWGSGRRGDLLRRRAELTKAGAARRVSPVVDRLRSGEIALFGEPSPVGFPPRWHHDPSSGHHWPQVHWTRIPDLGAHDVKSVWELGRFGFAYDLVRADADGDDRAASTFWELVRDFMAANPPNRGPHWMCGQETSIRTIALLTAGAWFRDHDETTNADRSGLIALLDASGR